VYPVINALTLSFFNWDGISPTRDFVRLHNYTELFFHDPVFWTAVLNTFQWTAFSLVLPTTLALTLVIVINQPLPGQTLIRTLIYVPSVLASIAVKEGITREHMLEILQNLRPGTSEIMCHPGYSDQELESMGSYFRIREQELAVLRDPSVVSAIDEHNITLTTCSALGF
jgi:hypothetical protein